MIGVLVTQTTPNKGQTKKAIVCLLCTQCEALKEFFVVFAFANSMIAGKKIWLLLKRAKGFFS